MGPNQHQCSKSADNAKSELLTSSCREADWWHGETQVFADPTLAATLGGVVGIDAHVAISEIASPHRGIACAGSQAHMYEYICAAHVLT